MIILPGVASYDVDILADRKVVAIRAKFGASGSRAESLDVSITATACRSNSLYSSSLNGLETVKSFIFVSLCYLNHVQR